MRACQSIVSTDYGKAEESPKESEGRISISISGLSQEGATSGYSPRGSQLTDFSPSSFCIEEETLLGEDDVFEKIGEATIDMSVRTSQKLYLQKARYYYEALTACLFSSGEESLWHTCLEQTFSCIDEIFLLFSRDYCQPPVQSRQGPSSLSDLLGRLHREEQRLSRLCLPHSSCQERSLRALRTLLCLFAHVNRIAEGTAV